MGRPRAPSPHRRLLHRFPQISPPAPGARPPAGRARPRPRAGNSPFSPRFQPDAPLPRARPPARRQWQCRGSRRPSRSPPTPARPARGSRAAASRRRAASTAAAASRGRPGSGFAGAATAGRRIFESRASVSRETGVSASARSLSAARSSAPCPALVQARCAARLPRFTCATRSVSAAGVMPSILLAWPMVRGRMVQQLLSDFVGKSAQRCVIEIVRQRETFIAPIARNIRRLAREIDVVLGIDFDLLGNFRRQLAEARPDLRETPQSSRADRTTARTRCAAVRLC